MSERFINTESIKLNAYMAREDGKDLDSLVGQVLEQMGNSYKIRQNITNNFEN